MRSVRLLWNCVQADLFSNSGFGRMGNRQLPLFLLQLEPVGDHGNELAVGGLALGVGDGVAEIFLALAAQCLQRILYSKNIS